MKAQVCLVLIAILGFAFSQSFLDKNTIQAASVAAQQLGTEFQTISAQVSQGVSEGQSFETILANLQGTEAQIANTLTQLQQTLTQDAAFMTEVNNYASQVNQQIAPTVEQVKALVAGLEPVAADVNNQTAVDEIKGDVELLKDQLVFAFQNNMTGIFSSVFELYANLSTAIESLGANVTSGTETKVDLEAFLAELKANVSSFVASNTDLHAGEVEIMTAINEVFANNTGLFTALQNYTSKISSDLTQVGVLLASQNDTDASQIVNSLGQIVGAYSTVYGSIATANFTDIFAEIKQANEQAYPTIYAAAINIFTVVENHLITIFKGLETTAFVAQIENLTSQVSEQAKQVFIQDAALLKGLHGLFASWNTQVIPNAQLLSGAGNVKSIIMQAIHANSGNVIKSVAQLAGKIVTDVLPLAEQILHRNETAMEMAGDLIKGDVDAYVANNTDLQTAAEQIKQAVAVAFANNTDFFAGLQNYSSQVATDLTQLAVSLNQENNTDAAAIATSLAQSVGGFSTGFSKIASGSDATTELAQAYESAANSTGKLIETELKEQINTLNNEVNADVIGNNTNNNTNNNGTNNNGTNNNQTPNGNQPDAAPLAAGKLAVSSIMAFGALVAFFL